MANHNGGRPKVSIDWKQFEAYCAIQCTLREIADYFNCADCTIERKVKEHYDCSFADIFKRKRQKGLMSLRANLFKLSEKQGNVAIFLAKNWLGMVEKQEIEHSGNIGLKAEDYSETELTAIIEGTGRSRKVKAAFGKESLN